MDLHIFDQHRDWFLAINPESYVPALDHSTDKIIYALKKVEAQLR